METPQGSRQTQGQVATGRPSGGQARSPADRAQEGLGHRTVFMHTFRAKRDGVGVHFGMCAPPERP